MTFGKHWLMRTSIAPIAIVLAFLSGVVANSAPKIPCDQGEQGGRGHVSIENGCHGTADHQSTGQGSGAQAAGGQAAGGANQVHTKSPKEIYDDKVAAIRKQNEQARQAYIAAINERNKRYQNGDCVFKADGQAGPDCGTIQPPNLIKVPNPPKGVAKPDLPPIPPIDAAYLAIETKLRINASGIGIGPDPDLSRWKMAVVGHSYWLWATGPTHLGPVSDSASGRTVTLNATLTSVNFEMGDGNMVKCKGAGTPYPGDKKGLYTKSPTCGYTYQTTSEHHAGGTYPVRATTYWSVAYSAPDGSGVIPIVLASERDLKVGELQTVITH